MLALNAPDVALPEPLAVTVSVFPPPVNTALAPLAGAVKVTVAVGIAMPPPSSTRTCSAVVKPVPIVAVWLLPARI